ncbi:MAG TPA: cytochrome c family protein [Terriglobia bacterium]|nr:cytochrome c family protein [Terriglobia bacterium]
MQRVTVHFAFLLVAAAALLSAGGRASLADDGDAAQGQKVFVKCQVCHSLDAGTNKIGPSLHGLIGRPSASIANFSYSQAMQNAHVTWDPATLDKYLTNPKAMVPGTKMLFPGLPKPEDRANLIAYLKQAAGSAQ